MKPILVVSPYEAEYGPRRTLEHAARAVSLAGFRPICVVRSADAIGSELAEARLVPELRTVPRTLDPRTIVRFLGTQQAAARAAAEIAKAERAGAVYTISEGLLAGGIAARRAGVPGITHVIGMSIGSPRLLAHAYVRVLDRLTTRFIACSSAATTMLTRSGVDLAKIDLVHNSISVGAVDAAAHLPSPLAGDGVTIGMIAAYDRRKGHDLFVEAAAHVADADPGARFAIVGGVLDARPESARFETEVRRGIAERGLEERFRLPGYIPQPSVYAWMRALDVVVAPSRTEGFAHTLLEAMTCARPVVATAVDGNLDAIVDGETGLLVEPTPGSLAAGVLSLLADRTRAAALGEAARASVVEHFDESVSIPLLAETIQRVAGSRASSSRPTSARR